MLVVCSLNSNFSLSTIAGPYKLLSNTIKSTQCGWKEVWRILLEAFFNHYLSQRNKRHKSIVPSNPKGSIGTANTSALHAAIQGFHQGTQPIEVGYLGLRKACWQFVVSQNTQVKMYLKRKVRNTIQEMKREKELHDIGFMNSQVKKGGFVQQRSKGLQKRNSHLTVFGSLKMRGKVRLLLPSLCIFSSADNFVLQIDETFFCLRSEEYNPAVRFHNRIANYKEITVMWTIPSRQDCSVVLEREGNLKKMNR